MIINLRYFGLHFSTHTPEKKYIVLRLQRCTLIDSLLLGLYYKWTLLLLRLYMLYYRFSLLNMPLFMTLVVFLPTKSLCFHYRSLYNYLNFYEIQVGVKHFNKQIFITVH